MVCFDMYMNFVPSIFKRIFTHASVTQLSLSEQR